MKKIIWLLFLIVGCSDVFHDSDSFIVKSVETDMNTKTGDVCKYLLKTDVMFTPHVTFKAACGKFKPGDRITFILDNRGNKAKFILDSVEVK